MIEPFMYVVAIKDTKVWQGTNAAELSMIGFWNLIIVWLKVNSIPFPPYAPITRVFTAPRSLAILPAMGPPRWN